MSKTSEIRNLHVSVEGKEPSEACEQRSNLQFACSELAERGRKNGVAL